MIAHLPLTSSECAARYRAQGLWRDETIADRFRKMAERFPDKVAIVERARSFTYRQFAALVDIVAGNLLDLGLAPGQVVAIQSKNAMELPLIHFACNRIGLLFMPLHDSWRDTELKHLLTIAKIPVVIVPGTYRDFDHVAMITSIRGDLPNLKHVYALDGASANARDFADLLKPTRRTRQELDARRPDPDLPASVMLSGGTTALSKISRFSSNDFLAMLSNFSNAIEMSETDIAAALAPAGTGATGYVYPIANPLMHGATSVILERWSDPQEAVDLIRAHRCTYAVGVPTQLTLMIPPLEKLRREDFSQFRCFFDAGAPLPYATGLKIETLMNCKIVSMYGATDGGSPTTTTIQDSQEKRLKSVGRVVAGCECELRDSTGHKVPPGESGEVCWRASDKSWGYLGDDAQTKAAFTEDHFYKSGDLGQFDSDGYLSIVGRVKDMILRGGRNIFPRTIEELLMRHPAVLDVSVAAMPDPVLGERACAFVLLKGDCHLEFDGMIQFLKEQKIAIWQLPERLEIVDDLPRGVGGKIVKSKLTALVAGKLKAEGKIPPA